MSQSFIDQLFHGKTTWCSRDCAPHFVTSVLDRCNEQLHKITAASDSVTNTQETELKKRCNTQFSVYKVTILGPMVQTLINIHEPLSVLRCGVHNEIITVHENKCGEIYIEKNTAPNWVQDLYVKKLSPLSWDSFRLFLRVVKLYSQFQWDSATITAWTTAYKWSGLTGYYNTLLRVKSGTFGTVSSCSPLPPNTRKRPAVLPSDSCSSEEVKKLKHQIVKKDELISNLELELADKSRVLEFTKSQLDLVRKRLHKLENPHEI